MGRIIIVILQIEELLTVGRVLVRIKSRS